MRCYNKGVGVSKDEIISKDLTKNPDELDLKAERIYNDVETEPEEFDDLDEKSTEFNFNLIEGMKKQEMLYKQEELDSDIQIDICLI